MAGLITAIPVLHVALSRARRDDVSRVSDALRSFGVTGVHGEPEVGVTSVVDDAIRRSDWACIRVDLDGVTSDGDVAALLARGLARLVVGDRELSLLSAPEIAPAHAQSAYVAFAERVGERVASLALAERPGADVSVDDVLTAIARTYQRAPVAPILWIDHLQAPSLATRHPVDVDALLWNVRSFHQRTEFPILVSGSRAVTSIAHGADGAFYGDGVWVTLARPATTSWWEVAAALPVPPSERWTTEMAHITHSHPGTMVLALALRDELPESGRTPLDLWQRMLALDDGLVGRAVQHARSLHRLGGAVLDRIAHGARPYEGARTKAEQNDRNRAVRRLYEAGLITQPSPRRWEVTNPLLAGRLRRELPFTVADAGPRATPDQP
jgi:hypothetical protein